ncbi:MAG: sigma 54-interacting transcriptional regulator [Acidobacteriota bacterium]
MQVWLHACAHVAAEAAAEARFALTAAGLEIAAHNVWPPPGKGILLFDTADDDFGKLLRGLHAAEDRCLIALGVRPRQPSECSPWPLLEAGASDVLFWNGRETAHEIAARLKRWEVVDERVRSPIVRENMIGRSALWCKMLRHLVEAAVFSQEPILLTGESGTGKELAARLIHGLDTRRAKRELVVVDCTTLMPELAGSELFGHERGSYTGAVAPRAGAIQLAHEGTLFLDEIGELGLTLQAQLLRVIQEKTYKRVGGNQWHKAEFRLVAATNRDLRAMVEEGTFRRDLYYRIASVPIVLPPLRERRDDVIPLARHFIRGMNQSGAQDLLLDPALEAYLLSRDYPGNVRDLRQLVARMMHRHCGTRMISPASLPDQERPSASGQLALWPDDSFLSSVRNALALGVGLQEIAREAKEAALNAAMELEDGSVKRAAERLGVTERAIQLRRAKGPAVQSDPQRQAESA